MVPPNEIDVASRSDSRSLAASLVPVLRQACGDRLGEVTWFKTDWQRGGAATGEATFQLDDGEPRRVIIKVPVVQRELQWTRRLQEVMQADENDVAPRLYASDATLGGYDLAWIVIERFDFGPLGAKWHDHHIQRIADAAARFQAATARFTVDQPPRIEPWPELLHDAAESVRVNVINRKREWLAALKALRSRIDRVTSEWEQRDVMQWLHGDLHLANAMSRIGMDHGQVSLIDLAEVHAGHWIEDAVYLERQLWGRPERLHACKPVKELAAARKRYGLVVEPTYPRLSMIRRALLAATAPRFLKSEGHPAYLDACLDWLEIANSELK